jgi:hypothetical protein
LALRFIGFTDFAVDPVLLLDDEDAAEVFIFPSIGGVGIPLSILGGD